MVSLVPGTGACSSTRGMGNPTAVFEVKRIYEDAADDDGCRVLVDRLWPRGITKERAKLDL